jgi:rubrerythrin
MNDEVRECAAILDEAVKFEETGMAFYVERGENAPNELERNLFRSLAEDEKRHKAYLLQIKSQLLAKNNPKDMQRGTGGGRRSTRDIFEAALEQASDPYTAEPAELKIIAGAMEVERKGYAMYTKAADTVASVRAKEIFRDLAREEQDHYALLKNTYDYLADPEAWHGFDENPLLDGG